MMRVLLYFDCDIEFLRERLRSGAVSLLDDVEAHSASRGAHWKGMIANSLGEWLPTDIPAVEVVEGVLSNRFSSCNVRRQPRRGSEDFVGIGRSAFSGLSCHVSVVVDSIHHEALFVKLCERLRPIHAHYLPRFEGLAGSSKSVLTMALSRDFRMMGWAESDQHVTRARALAVSLPRIEFMGLRSTDVRPNELGWLNYWSAETAAILGFPDPAKDARILPLCRQLTDGAWLVKLTDEPLDLEREEHVEAIVWAYWRFDKVGKRLQPADGKMRPRARKSVSSPAPSAGSRTFVLRERDEGGKWWEASAEPIVASSAEDALRIHFAKMAHGRPPRPRETLASLRAAYDAVAVEVGLTRADDMEAVEAPD